MMKTKFKITLLTMSMVFTQAAYSDQITDTYTTGDTLTADMLNNIKSAVNDVDQRLLPLEARANGQTVNVDCTSDPAALKNLTFASNTTYVLSGICDGQVVVGPGLGPVNIEGDGIGVQDDGITLAAGETDANTVFAAIYASGSQLSLSDLVIDVTAYNGTSDLYIAGVGSYNGASVYMENVSVVGGDEGIGAYNGGVVFIDQGVSVTGFRAIGLAAARGSVVRARGAVTVTGGSNQEGSSSEAIAAFDQGHVDVGGGGTIEPASGTGLSSALDTAAAVSSNRNGSIRVIDATVNGTVWSGNDSNVRLQNVTQSGGNIDTYRLGYIRVRNSSVAGAAGDGVFAGVFSVIRMDSTSIGNASGTGSINIYNFGVVDLRGTSDLNGRDINCSEPREVRIIGGLVANVGTVSCFGP